MDKQSFSTNKKFYLTSAIPYVNASPHIGHAQEFVYSDVIRRYHKLLDEGVTYLCGADENALKIVQAAEKAGQTPQKFCDVKQQEFLNLAKNLDVQFDVWQRGSDKIHHFPSSQKLWDLCQKAGDIYKKSYTGLYCVGCEQFYTPDELDENGECFEHPGKKLDKVSEENYFFKLSRYQDFIEKLINSDELKITPEIRKNEALAFVRKGLQDFSISRSKERAKNWGVPVPGDPNQIIYVWFDALNIYQSGIGFGWNEENYKKWAPQDLMVIGKGILRFHAIYWPAILRSAGLPWPKSLFIHGYLTVNGQKMSKTIGNVVDPQGIISKYGKDALRYYLLREIPSHGDGDFSESRFKELYNADLANGLGNLVARVAKLAEGLSFKPNPTTEKIIAEIPTTSGRIPTPQAKAINSYNFDEALGLLWGDIKVVDEYLNDYLHLPLTVRDADQYINNEAPWKLEPEKRQQIIQVAVDAIRYLATQLQPFLPETAGKILKQFAGPKIKSEKPLFPRL